MKTVLLSLLLILSVNVSAKSRVGGYPYTEVDDYYRYFNSSVRGMVNQRGGSLTGTVTPLKMHVGVGVYRKTSDIPSSVKKIFNYVDFGGDLSKSGGAILSKVAFYMKRKHSSFYGINEQMSKEQINHILLNTVIRSGTSASSGRLSVYRLFNIDLPIFGGEKVIPLNGSVAVTDGQNVEGDSKLGKLAKRVRALDSNLRSYSYDMTLIHAAGERTGDLIKGVSAVYTYYHVNNEYDYVVGYQLGRMDKIPWLAPKSVIDRLENRTRMEIAYLIYQMNR